MYLLPIPRDVLAIIYDFLPSPETHWLESRLEHLLKASWDSTEEYRIVNAWESSEIEVTVSREAQTGFYLRFCLESMISSLTRKITSLVIGTPHGLLPRLPILSTTTTAEMGQLFRDLHKEYVQQEMLNGLPRFFDPSRRMPHDYKASMNKQAFLKLFKKI